MEHFSKIGSIKDIHARANWLEKTLQWQESEPGKTWHLISTASQRVLETIKTTEHGQFMVGVDQHYKDIFNTLESAQVSAKFGIIKSILREDLGSRYIQ